MIAKPYRVLLLEFYSPTFLPSVLVFGEHKSVVFKPFIDVVSKVEIVTTFGKQKPLNTAALIVSIPFHFWNSVRRTDVESWP